MDTPASPMTPSSLIRYGFAMLAKPPFRTLWLLLMLIVAATPSIGAKADDLAIATTLLFALLTFVVEIAAILAAGATEPDRSADAWIRGAVRRRCLWRLILAEVLTDLAVGAGVFLLLVGALVIAGIIGLAPQAAVLERRMPLQAISRSAVLTRPARGRVATVYGVLVLVPTLVAVIPLFLGIERNAATQILIGALTGTVGLAAWIALTKAFTELGGAHTPALTALDERARASARD